VIEAPAPTEESEILRSVNTPPFYRGYDRADQRELPEWIVNVGEATDYILPETTDRENDQVYVYIIPGRPLLKDCGCLLLNQDKGIIRVTAPVNLAGKSSLIQVFLADENSQGYYFFYLRVVGETESETKKQGSVKGPVVLSLAEQY